MLRWQAKVISGVIMLVATLFCFLLPVPLVPMFRKWGTRGQYALDLLSCFAGGVFLATYLVFMAPAVRVLIENNLTGPRNIHYPLSDFIIGIGFFIVPAIHLLVRLIKRCNKMRADVTSRRSRKYWSKRGNTAVNYNGRHEESTMTSLTSHTELHADSLTGRSGYSQNGTSGNDRNIADGEATTRSQPAPSPDRHSASGSTGSPLTAAEYDRRFNLSLSSSNSTAVKHHLSRHDSSPSSTILAMESPANGTESNALILQRDAVGQEPDFHGLHKREVRPSTRDENRGGNMCFPSNCCGERQVSRSNDDRTNESRATDSSAACVSYTETSVTRSAVLMLIQSIDSLLDGMIIGLKSSIVEVWSILLGVLIHSVVIAFCIGLQLARINKGRPLPVVVAGVIYSIMNPIGLTLATCVYELSTAATSIDIANGIIQALTSGCFIYVTFYEILEGQISDQSPPTKILAVLIGYLFLSAFGAIPEDNHSPVADLINGTGYC